MRAVGPQTLLPTAIEKNGRARLPLDLKEGLAGCDVVIMLRLQNERMNRALLPSAREYFKCYGLTPETLSLAKPDAIVMHPGPMNRGVQIASEVADGPPGRDSAAGHLWYCGAHGGHEHSGRELSDARTSRRLPGFA